MVSKRLLFLLQRPAYVDDRPLETLDALLVAAAFEQRVSLLFRGAGVTLLLPEQAPERGRNLSKVLQSLAVYDVDAVYADSRALQTIGGAQACAIPVTPLDPAGIQRLLAEQDAVLCG